MAYLSQLNVNDNDYDLKDTEARNDLQSTQTISGNPLTLTDAAPINAEKLEVVLEPKQDLHGQSYPYVGGAGKNLYNPSFYAITDRNNVTQTHNSDESITLSGTTNGTYYGYFISNTNPLPLAAGNYYVSLRKDGNFFSGASIRVARMKNGATESYVDTSNGKAAITMDGTEDGLAIWLYCASGVNLTGNYTLQIEKGSEPTSYAPYTNICPISGYDEVEVESVGFNVFDEDVEIGGIDSTTGEDESANRIRSKYIKILPNQTYYICYNGSLSLDGLYIHYYDAEKNHLTSSTLSNTTFDYKINATTNSLLNAEYMRFTVPLSYGVTYSNDICINLSKTTGTPKNGDYLPYQSTTASITFGQTVYGGKSDFVEGGTKSEWENVDLGDLTWTMSSTPGRFYGVIPNSYAPYKWVSNLGFKCSIYKPDGYGNSNGYYGENGTIRYYWTEISTPAYEVYVVDGRYSDPISFKAAITGQTICYQKATPTTLTTPIAPLKLLDGINNISTNGTTINLGYQQNNVVGELKGEIEQAANNFTYTLLMSDETSCSLAYTDDYTSVNVEIPLVQTYTDTQTQQNYTVDYTNCEFAINGVDIICADYQHDWVLGAEWKVIPQIGSAFKQDGKLKVSVYLRNWKLTSSDNTIRYVMLMLDTLAFGKYVDSRTL